MANQLSDMSTNCPAALPCHLNGDLRCRTKVGRHKLEIRLQRKISQETTDGSFTTQIPSRKVVTRGLVCFHNINFAGAMYFKCQVEWYDFVFKLVLALSSCSTSCGVMNVLHCDQARGHLCVLSVNLLIKFIHYLV